MKRMMKLHKDSKGFTLIELMIVVAIIGILAAIAIPNFLRYQLKSKTAEAKTNIGAIKTSQEAFRAEWDGYAPCAINPGTAASDVKQAWGTPAANSGFAEIGYAPSGNVYYQYGVAVAGGTAVTNIAGSTMTGQSGGYRIEARGDLDKNATFGYYGMSNDITQTYTAVVTGFPGSPSKNGVVEDLAPSSF